jgi:hypothetical protein
LLSLSQMMHYIFFERIAGQSEDLSLDQIESV